MSTRTQNDQFDAKCDDNTCNIRQKPTTTKKHVFDCSKIQVFRALDKDGFASSLAKTPQGDQIVNILNLQQELRLCAKALHHVKTVVKQLPLHTSKQCPNKKQCCSC